MSERAPFSQQATEVEKPKQTESLEALEQMIQQQEFQENLQKIVEAPYKAQKNEVNQRVLKDIAALRAPLARETEALSLSLVNEDRTVANLPACKDVKEASKELKGKMKEYSEKAQGMLKEKTYDVLGGSMKFAEIMDPSFVEKYLASNPEATQALDQIAHQEQAAVLKVGVELTEIYQKLYLYSSNPEFVHALEVWGASPDLKKTKEGSGKLKAFHAGMIHFFQYRSDKDKSGRFYEKSGEYREHHALNLDDFIHFSQDMESLMNNPDAASNERIEKSALIGDSEGNQRLTMLTKDGLFVIGFRNTREAMKLVTIFPGDIKQFEGSIKKELENAGGAERVNELGKEGRRLLPLESQK